jgi:hypothetical protein
MAGGEHQVRPYDGERFSCRRRAAGLESEPRPSNEMIKILRPDREGPRGWKASPALPTK